MDGKRLILITGLLIGSVSALMLTMDSIRTCVKLKGSQVTVSASDLTLYSRATFNVFSAID
jgi:hypothetical protein